jgi:hypothetical protein
MNEPLTAARVFTNIADRLEALQTYDRAAILATGIGEALISDEITELVDNPDGVAFLAAHCRKQAERETAP